LMVNQTKVVKMKSQKSNTPTNKGGVNLRFVDLFCGIGGFRFAIQAAAKKNGFLPECVLSSDIDQAAQNAYEANFGERPLGDITKVKAQDVPDHDILLGGFPCQAFSIIGAGRGFEDTRGTLFFDVARILKEKKPRAFVLENVKQLRGHDHGRTLNVILTTLIELGYWVDYRILNALDFGLPQKRERILIVGFRQGTQGNFKWPEPNPELMTPLEEILEDDRDVPIEYYASEKIRLSRQDAVAGKTLPKGRTIWHENKSGNISALPYSCALRAGASYNYLLVDGKRRLTMREMLRLQGFPKTFKIVCNYSETRKQAGNSVPVPMITAVVNEVLRVLKSADNEVSENLGWTPSVAVHQESLPINF
jgi:DNA (cytosine-5)-methyltransferase 1